MLKDIGSIAAFVVMLSAAVAVEAGPIAVVNAGFEDDPLAVGDFAVLLHHTGWSATTNTFIVSGIAHPPLAGLPNGVDTIDIAPEGNQYGFSRNGVGLQQILAETFDPSQSYTLNVLAALSSETTESDLGYRIEFGTAGGSAFAPLAFLDFNQDAGTPRDDMFRDVSVTWNPGDFQSPGTTGDPLYIRLTTNGSNGNQRIGAAFDDVRFASSATVSAVPEPATSWLLAVGGLAALAFRRRRCSLETATRKSLLA